MHIMRMIIILKMFTLILSQLEAESNQCMEGFQYSPSTRKCYSFGKLKQTFLMAELSCKGIGARLLEVMNEMEQRTVAELANRNFGQGTRFWIGASKQNTGWQWSNGSGFNSEIFNLPDAGNCAFAHDGNLGSTSCDYEMNYICESTPAIEESMQLKLLLDSEKHFTTPLPNQTPPVPFCPPDWHYFHESDSCYIVKYNQNWDNAEKECVKLQAHLTSVHSEAENTFVSSLTSVKATRGVGQAQTWLGLYRPKDLAGPHVKGWRWTDGSPDDFYFWETTQNEPNDGTGVIDEDCAQMYTSTSYETISRWNDFSCWYMMRSYVCKRKRNNF